VRRRPSRASALLKTEMSFTRAATLVLPVLATLLRIELASPRWPD
jgi:hypothetical protein